MSSPPCLLQRVISRFISFASAAWNRSEPSLAEMAFQDEKAPIVSEANPAYILQCLLFNVLSFKLNFCCCNSLTISDHCSRIRCKTFDPGTPWFVKNDNSNSLLRIR